MPRATLETIGIRPSATSALHHAGLDLDDVADQPEVDPLAVDLEVVRLGGEQVGVLAGEPDRERPVRVDQADDLALHLADEHHPHDVHRLGVVTRCPAAKTLTMPSRSSCRGDLRAAAVHDDRAHPGVPEEDHVLGERLLQRLVGHRVAAELDHDVRPWKRSSQGSASTRTWPWPCCVEAAVVARERSCGHVEYAEFSCT